MCKKCIALLICAVQPIVLAAPMACQTVFDVGKTMAENATNELVDMSTILFVLAIIIEAVWMMIVKGRNKTQPLIAMGITVVAYLIIQFATNGVLVNTINSITGLSL